MTRTISLIALLGLMAVALAIVQFNHRGSATSATATSRQAMDTPLLIFQSLAPGDEHGRVIVLGLTPGGTRRVTSLSCTRVHYAGGRGVCIVPEPRSGETVHVAYVLNHDLTPTNRIELDGVPTHVRVSPTGRVAAISTFGDGHMEDGRLVPNSIVIDLSSGAVVADLRQFTIDAVGAPRDDGALAVTGLVFEGDGNRFFATLATDTEPVLVAGSLSGRRITALRTGVSNEALSPDGRRLIVKKLLPTRGFWQLAVIDLTIWEELELAQGPRSVDEQVEWLDDHHVVYHDVDGATTSLWSLAADGRSGPTVLVRNASSGAVAR